MEWIDSKRRLPDKLGDYLVYVVGSHPDLPVVTIAYYRGPSYYYPGTSHWYGPLVTAGADFTHWMPLPLPPVGE